MTEDEKIKEIICKYRSYFEHSIADVGHTEKGRWFFYEREKGKGYYHSFVEFTKAEELEMIIAESVAEDINVFIDVATDSIQCKMRYIDINEASRNNYDRCIPELLKNLRALNQGCHDGMEMLDKIFGAVSGMLEEVNKKQVK